MLRGLEQIKGCSRLHGIYIKKGRRGHVRKNSVKSAVGQGIVSRNKVGNIAAGLLGQEGANFPVVGLASGGANGLGHVARPCIVGSKGELPVVKHVKQLEEVAACGVGRLYRVRTLVDVVANLKALNLAGGIHELPQTFGSGGACGQGV